MKDPNNKYCQKSRAIKEVVVFIMIIDTNIKINNLTIKDLNYQQIISVWLRAVKEMQVQ